MLRPPSRKRAHKPPMATQIQAGSSGQAQRQSSNAAAHWQRGRSTDSLKTKWSCSFAHRAAGQLTTKIAIVSSLGCATGFVLTPPGVTCITPPISVALPWSQCGNSKENPGHGRENQTERSNGESSLALARAYTCYNCTCYNMEDWEIRSSPVSACCQLLAGIRLFTVL